MTDLSIIKKEQDRDGIKERCGNTPVAIGMECPKCGCREVYSDGNDKDNTEKWYFMILAFRVDNYSHCTNCGEWFGEEYL